MREGERERMRERERENEREGERENERERESLLRDMWHSSLEREREYIPISNHNPDFYASPNQALFYSPSNNH
eukprot:1388808-Amorphochlora_amoeboformis.AAC.1